MAREDVNGGSGLHGAGVGCLPCTPAIGKRRAQAVAIASPSDPVQPTTWTSTWPLPNVACFPTPMTSTIRSQGIAAATPLPS